MDQDALQKDLLNEFIELGDSLKAELWSAQNKQFLEHIARDITGLSLKRFATDDQTKRARYKRSIDVLTNHVAVMAFSRLNVVEKETSATVFRVLEKAANAVLDKVGDSHPS